MKRILAIILIFILTLPFVLTSCNGDDVTTVDEEAEKRAELEEKVEKISTFFMSTN